MEIIDTAPEPVQRVVHEDIQELMKFLIDKVAQSVNLKCCGFKVVTANIYCSIACHQLAELDIVIEDQNLITYPVLKTLILQMMGTLLMMDVTF